METKGKVTPVKVKDWESEHGIMIGIGKIYHSLWLHQISPQYSEILIIF